jgi:hypothetical protein
MVGFAPSEGLISGPILQEKPDPSLSEYHNIFNGLVLGRESGVIARNGAADIA